MMDLYVCKNGLPGVAAGRVERFHQQKAMPLLAAGELERFDPKNKDHAAKLAKQENESEQRRDREQRRLDAEFKARGLKH